MGAYSARSEQRLSQVHPSLQHVFRRIIGPWDHTILVGFRGKAEQDLAFRTGRSSLAWPKSKHNGGQPRNPIRSDGQPFSLAVDAAPWPIDWDDIERFRAFGGYVLGVGDTLGIPIRWGGDWDGDRDFKDQRLIDLVHFELLVW